ncbi:MAG: hypothetical protein KatS3mg027_0607 [Bacteroidia bacterium]|nr:MAG: hypothetical protein KatS3mg027_0607 [Bacteroidia bacterium]
MHKTKWIIGSLFLGCMMVLSFYGQNDFHFNKKNYFTISCKGRAMFPLVSQRKIIDGWIIENKNFSDTLYLKTSFNPAVEMSFMKTYKRWVWSVGGEVGWTSFGTFSAFSSSCNCIKKVNGSIYYLDGLFHAAYRMDARKFSILSGLTLRSNFTYWWSSHEAASLQYYEGFDFRTSGIFFIPLQINFRGSVVFPIKNSDKKWCVGIELLGIDNASNWRFFNYMKGSYYFAILGIGLIL